MTDEQQTDDGGRAERRAMNASPGQQGVIGAEHQRRAAQSVPEAEREAFASACRLADARGFARPDRAKHRRAFYARHNYRKGK